METKELKVGDTIYYIDYESLRYFIKEYAITKIQEDGTVLLLSKEGNLVTHCHLEGIDKERCNRYVTSYTLEGCKLRALDIISKSDDITMETINRLSTVINEFKRAILDRKQLGIKLNVSNSLEEFQGILKENIDLLYNNTYVDYD